MTNVSATVIFQQQIVAAAMRKWGGSFVESLGTALVHADPINAQKIHDAWPEIWNEYLNMGSENA